MAVQIPVTNDGNRLITVDPGNGISYLFRTYFSVGAEDAWFLDISDSAGGPLLVGIPVVPGSQNLLAGQGDNFRDAQLLAIASSGTGQEANSLGNTLYLLWINDGEINPLDIGDPLLNVDARANWGWEDKVTVSTNDHSVLDNRFIAGQHNITAIAGLRTELDGLGADVSAARVAANGASTVANAASATAGAALAAADGAATAAASKMPIAPDDGKQYAATGSTWSEVAAGGGGGEGTTDHRALSNRDAADSHPQSAITGLVAALAGKAAASDLDSLATKTELSAGLSGKAALSHTHTTADVTGLGEALDAKADLASGKVPVSQLPIDLVAQTWTVDTTADLTALVDANPNDFARITTGADAGKVFVLVDADPTVLADWLDITNQGGVIAVNGKTGVVTLDLADLPGVIAALDNKADSSDLSGYATTTALASGLAGKADAVHTHTTAQVTGLDTALSGKADASALANYATTSALSTVSDAAAAAQSTADGAVSGLAAKANAADLGGMALVDDAPGDGAQYARKDGEWVEVEASGGSGGDYELPIASTSTLGGIKPDGVTLTVNPETGVAMALGENSTAFPLMVGQAVPYFGEVNDTEVFQPNFVYADGRALIRDEHPELFAAYGARYGLGNVGDSGIPWTQTAMPVYGNWNSVAYGNGRFVTVAQGSSVAAYSRNGITWTQTTMPASSNWQSVTYGNGRFVTVAQSSNVAAYSDDGITWTRTTLPANSAWYSVTYGNGRFVAFAAGNINAAYSGDGITWTAMVLPVSATWNSVTYGNGIFVAVSSTSNIALYSRNGITWTLMTLPGSNATWQSVTYGNGRFVTVAQSSNVAAYSDDGITWTRTTLPANSAWYSVTYGNDLYVAVAASNTYGAYSTDGITWIQTVLPVSAVWRSIAYGNGLYVATATNNSIATYGVNAANVFNIPDLRGVFVRGLDEGRGLDSGRTLGVLQGDAIRNITAEASLHSSGGLLDSRSSSAAVVAGAFKLGEANYSYGPQAQGYSATSLAFDASRVVPTAAENRPVNMPAHWFIVAQSPAVASSSDFTAAINAVNASVAGMVTADDLGELAYVDDAPNDGAGYVRKDGAWEAQSTGGGGGVTVHNELTGRDAANAHPMSAIAGLVDALDGKADDADLAALATKAEVAVVADDAGQAAIDATTALAGLDDKASAADLAILADMVAGKADASALSNYATTTALTDGLATKAAVSHTHAAADVAGLDTALAAKADLVGGRVPTSQLPVELIAQTWDVEAIADLTTLTGAHANDFARITAGSDEGKSFVLVRTDPTVLANWIDITSQGGVVSVNGHTGVVALALADLPDAADTLAAKANVADVDSALALKADASELSNLATTSALATGLAGKADAVHTHTTAQVTGLDTALAAKADASALANYATTSALTSGLAAKANIASPTFTGTPAGPTASAGTNTTQLATTAFVQTAVSGVGGSAETILHVREQQSAGVSGGTFTAGALRTRALNTVVTNTISGASLNASTYAITLPAGTYHVAGWAVGVSVDMHKALLANSGGTALITGATGFSPSWSANNNQSTVVGMITLASSTVLYLRHICSTTAETYGFGYTIPGWSSYPEIYAELFIRKVG